MDDTCLISRFRVLSYGLPSQVMFKLDPGAPAVEKNGAGKRHMSPTRLAETIAAAFEDAAMGSDGPKGISFKKFYRWYLR